MLKGRRAKSKSGSTVLFGFFLCKVYFVGQTRRERKEERWWKQLIKCG